MHYILYTLFYTLCLNTLFYNSSLALSLRSLSDSVLHLFYTLLYTPCLLYSPFFSFSLNLFFFLCLFPSLHLTFLLLPSLLFSHFLPLYLFFSLCLSFIVLLFDSPSLPHPLLSFSPSSTTFRWEVFNSTDDQKVMGCSRLIVAYNQHIQQISKLQCNLGKPFSFKNDKFILDFVYIYLEKLSCQFKKSNRIEFRILRQVTYFNMLFDGTEFFLVQDF